MTARRGRTTHAEPAICRHLALSLGSSGHVPEQILDSNILVLGTPVWMGQPSSVVKRVLERMDAFLSETDDAGRMVSYGRVGIVAVVGNEDGAHHVSAEQFQVLSDVGFPVPPNGVTYWVGEAMQSTDYIDLPKVPENTATTTATAASNAAHLARLLSGQQYPGTGSSPARSYASGAGGVSEQALMQ